jgi:hypothetical protein
MIGANDACSVMLDAQCYFTYPDKPVSMPWSPANDRISYAQSNLYTQKTATTPSPEVYSMS